jgi:hypothetical protein
MIDEEPKAKLNESIKQEMEDIQIIINNNDFETVIEVINDDVEKLTNNDIKSMVEHCKILKVNDKDIILEYRDIIEDEYMFESFLNYTRLFKPVKYVNDKVNENLNNKFICGLQKVCWMKIKYLHLLKEILGMDDIFDINNIKLIDLNNTEYVTTIQTIKKVYNKRDNIKAEDYTRHTMVLLYIFMLNNLIKNLKLITSSKITKGELRNKIEYSINDEVKSRLDTLRNHMNKSNIETDDKNIKETLITFLVEMKE